MTARTSDHEASIRQYIQHPWPCLQQNLGSFLIDDPANIKSQWLIIHREAPAESLVLLGRRERIGMYIHTIGNNVDLIHWSMEILVDLESHKARASDHPPCLVG